MDFSIVEVLLAARTTLMFTTLAEGARDGRREEAEEKNRDGENKFECLCQKHCPISVTAS